MPGWPVPAPRRRCWPGLPVLGVCLGQLIGADPLGFLLSGGAGGWLLVVGVTLACCGLLWSDGITGRALMRPKASASEDRSGARTGASGSRGMSRRFVVGGSAADHCGPDAGAGTRRIRKSRGAGIGSQATRMRSPSRPRSTCSPRASPREWRCRPRRPRPRRRRRVRSPRCSTGPRILLALGADPATAWSNPALPLDNHGDALLRLARRSAASGSALAQGVADLAEQSRHDAASAADARAQRASVLIAGPLGLCYLPAFVCLGIVPIVAGLAGDVLRSGLT